MSKTTLVIGGCRSGKSRHALKLAEKTGGRCNLFVATCVPLDAEMNRRIAQHQKERSDCWYTLEEPLELAQVVVQQGANKDAMVIDCLTLWISNLMHASENEQWIANQIKSLCNVLKKPSCPVILVTNEVGTGIVPENSLARRYRDLTGWANQQVANVCSQVIWMVAGIACQIKPHR